MGLQISCSFHTEVPEESDLREDQEEPRCRVRRLGPAKADGGKRPFGIPTVADRIAQEAARRHLEPAFHADSYGYRPGKSAIASLGLWIRELTDRLALMPPAKRAASEGHAKSLQTVETIGRMEMRSMRLHTTLAPLRQSAR
jgi:hypothetical protein